MNQNKNSNNNIVRVFVYLPVLLTVISCGQQQRHADESKPDSNKQAINKAQISQKLIISYKTGTLSNNIDEFEATLPRFTKKSLSSKTVFVYDFFTIENSVTAKKLFLKSKLVENISNDRTFKIDRNFGYK